MIDLASRESLAADLSALFDSIRRAPSTIWIALRPDEDIAADAEAIRQRLLDGADLPLAGTTFAVKDNIDIAGFPTTAAHPAFARSPQRSATVVERLLLAGALLVGKTNMDQFATGLVGTRSPYGVVTSALDPQRVAGGSSSGSGASVGLGLVDFSLGTDTAGSGRVPAAFNGILGIKPTLGLLPLDGVVPASPSYDTVSVFARTTTLAARVMDAVVGVSATDPRSRPWPADAPLAAPALPVVALPHDADLASLSLGAREAFDAAVAQLARLGVEFRTIDLRPMLDSAQLLYGGGLVSERVWSYGAFLQAHPGGADPSVATIAQRAMATDGVAVIDAQQAVAAAKLQTRHALAGMDALLIPTAPVHPTVAEVAEDPLGVNSRVGTFTNFVNLLDMAAVAVPVPTSAEGGYGVSIVVPAFHDQVALDIASRLVGEAEEGASLAVPGVELAVFGAHLRGEPLNAQLQSLGARFVRDVRTRDTFRMLLVEGEIERPAVIRAEDGAELPGELWRLSPLAVSQLLRSISAPLALGEVELADGSAVLGFTASVDRTERDITGFGGWRAFRAASSQPVTV
ncbi:allophanate hydrolase [Microbacterium sp. ZKA21]|uniref:allophanate hydrolase n=1 Tax=Microbacterium sp. ZKA21 TaxID=3381694 RepID=UPI003D24ACDF